MRLNPTYLEELLQIACFGLLAARHLAAAASVGVGDWERDAELYLATHALQAHPELLHVK